jgi:aspartate 1-decarboxylase
MQRTFLKAKLHRVTTTASEVDYEGSCEIGSFEQIQIYNINNGKRFTTYAIRGKDNSGVISVNGAASHKADVGDLLIIASYATYNEKELKDYAPKLCYVNENNILVRTNSNIEK